MKVVDLIKSKGIVIAVEQLYPVKFVSNHVGDNKNNNGWIKIFLGTIYLIIISLCKKRKLLKKDYVSLVYIPNFKYVRFLDVFMNDGFDYIVISEDTSLNDFINPSKFNVRKFLKNLYELLIYASNKSDFKTFQINYWLIINALRREIILDEVLNKINFKNYLSLHPVGDFHLILETFYQHKFESTFAIRPTTTSENLENKFIKTKNLLYKSQEEYNIYKKVISSNINLIKSGIIIKKETLKNINSNIVLFVDSCTNKEKNSLSIRREVIGLFLTFSELNGLNVYFKFHPGLLKNEINITKEKIVKINSNRIEILKDQIPWNKIKVVIGFDSTLFYDSIIRNIPVLSFHDRFSLFKDKSEFYDTPILSIKDEKGFEHINKLFNDKKYYNDVVSQQYKWFVDKYNYPEGMNVIRRILR